jgi:endonuclease/exonuclease/phosphatase family metal-dependent hydrolase
MTRVRRSPRRRSRPSGRRTALVVAAPLAVALAMALTVLPASALPSEEPTAEPTAEPSSENADVAGDGTTDGTTDATTDASDRRAKRSMIKIATLNTAAFQSRSRAVDDVRRLARSGVDVMGLQEMASAKRRSQVNRKLVSCRGCRWASYVPAGSTRASTPIYWKRKQYKLLKRGSVFVTPPTRVGSHGAGPARLNAKYITWVRLRDRATGRKLWVLNNHAVPSVQGRRGGHDKSHPERLRLYKKHMIKLQDRVQACTRKGGLVFVIGDFNVNYRTDRRTRAHRFPSYRLGRVGLRNSYGPLGEPAGGSHSLRSGKSTRLIDHVWFAPRKALEPRRLKLLRGYNSDHRPLVVKFESRRGR